MDPNLKALHLGHKTLHLGHKTLLMILQNYRLFFMKSTHQGPSINNVGNWEGGSGQKLVKIADGQYYKTADGGEECQKSGKFADVVYGRSLFLNYFPDPTVSDSLVPTGPPEIVICMYIIDNKENSNFDTFCLEMQRMHARAQNRFELATYLFSSRGY